MHTACETATDPASNTITYSYDDVGQRAAMTAPDGGIFIYAYNARGAMHHLVNPQGDRTTFSYDGLHQLKAVVAPDGARTSLSYDSNGWCNGIERPDGTRHTYTYEDWDTTEVTCKHLIVEAEDIDLMREPQLLYADRDFVASYGHDEALEALQEDFGRCLIIACGKACRFLEDKKCSIYPTRPNACVAFQAGDEQCQEVRQIDGLPPLPPKQ